MKFIANYIKVRKAYTTYRNHTSSQCQFKTGVPQGGVLHQHYSTYTLQTCHHQEHQFRSWATQMTSPSHLHTQARVQKRNTYLHKGFAWTLNPDKTTCTLFTPDSAEYKSNLDLKINNTALRTQMFWALP